MISHLGKHHGAAADQFRALVTLSGKRRSQGGTIDQQNKLGHAPPNEIGGDLAWKTHFSLENAFGIHR